MQSANWINSAEKLMKMLDGSPTVSGIVPSGFPRYLRAFSPASVRSSNDPDSLELHLPWSLICEQLGVELKPNTLWQRDIVSADARIADLQEPGLGSRDTDLPERLGKILQSHEAADRSWHFATWAGYGVVEGKQPVWFPSHHHDSLEMSVFERWNEASAPFTLPVVPVKSESRAILKAFGHQPPADLIPPGEIPMYWWPEGSEWVLGQALYGRSVYLVCSDEIAEEILATSGIEAIEVSLFDEAEYEE